MRSNTVTVDLALLLESWELALLAERKSPATIKAYGDGVRRFLTWAEREGREPALDRSTVASFVAELLENGAGARHRTVASAGPASVLGWLVEKASPRRIGCSVPNRPSST